MTSSSDHSLNPVDDQELDLNQETDLVADGPPRFTDPPVLPQRNGQKLGSDGLTYPVAFIQITFDATTGNTVGGMLVTDNTGIPLEFLITSAVRPTRAQHILYGKRLKSFVAINLCATQLVNDIKTTPKVVFVHDDFMLGLSAHTSLPVLMLQQTEQLGTLAPRPTVIPPRNKPEYAELIDLTSLNADMIDAFDRIEKCREVLAARNDEYKI
jgi:hypothetical protein